MAFDFKNPDYAEVFEQRAETLLRIRARPDLLPDLKLYYRENPAEFINDWGVTFDPRNAERGLPTVVPFLLFDRQREWIDYIIRKWRAQEPGLTEKSRDCGITWLAVSLACTLCLFYDGLAIGFGSRKEEYVDKIGTLKPILPKGRMFMDHLPEEFRGGYVSWRDAPFMRIAFPESGSLIVGEAGDDIGRGDREAIYFLDEAAHIERAHLVDMSLSQTTNCRQDISSVKGMNNPFAQKRHGGKIEPFIFDWRQDPRKDDAWYAKQCAELDEIVVAQEIDRDYLASVAGVVIPAEWVRSCIDACEKLGIKPSGSKHAALDVADEGPDKNAFCGAFGVEIQHLEEWSGKGSDIYETTQRAVNICDEHGYHGFRYDEDGLGAGVRGDMRVINEKRLSLGARVHKAEGWRGSAGVTDPEGIVEGTTGIDEGDKGRTNQDYFANHKAQGWWSLRKRIQKTHRWVKEGKACDPDEILSISTKAKNWQKLVSELSQATYAQNAVGKMVINKKPSGMPSPNYADAVMIDFAPGTTNQIIINQELIQRAGALPHRRRH